MTDRNKFEQMLEHLINDESDKAKELFHQIVVAKSREIYETILAEDFNEAKDEEEDDEQAICDPVPNAQIQIKCGQTNVAGEQFNQARSSDRIGQEEAEDGCCCQGDGGIPFRTKNRCFANPGHETSLGASVRVALQECE